MKEFKKFFLSVLVVLVIVFAADFVLGTILDKAAVFVDQPKYKRIENSTEDVIVLGASRAENQYVTEIIQEGLNMPSYNYGVGARNIYSNYAVLHLLLNKAVKKPKVIIWDFYYTDITDSPGWNTEQLDGLYSAYNYDATVKEMVNLQGEEKRLLLNGLKLYKFNSKLPKAMILPFRKDHGKDYFPLYVVHKDPIKENHDDRLTLDPTKLAYIDRFISLCKENDIKLFVFVSPAYYLLPDVKENDWSKVIERKCNAEGIPFFNYEQNPDFLAHPEWFYNAIHLNDNGAREYSRRIVSDIKQTGLLQ